MVGLSACKVIGNSSCLQQKGQAMIPRPKGLGYYELLTLFRGCRYRHANALCFSRPWMCRSILLRHKATCNRRAIDYARLSFSSHDRCPFWHCHSRKAPVTIFVCPCARSFAFATLTTEVSRVTGFFRSGRTIRPERFSSIGRPSTTNSAIIQSRFKISFR